VLDQRPILCLVSDRRRLAARAPLDALLEQVREAACEGVDLIQIRERDLTDRELYGLVQSCVAAARGSPARIIVNDRLDVAVAAGAAGVHLRADGIPGAAGRSAVSGGFLLGRSVHSLEEATAAVRAGGLDYLIFGPVFETSSKPGRPPAGLDRLREVAALGVPVLAIGGVSRHAVPQVAQTGAAGVAAIGLFAEAARVSGGGGLAAVVREVRRAFDTSRHVI